MKQKTSFQKNVTVNIMIGLIAMCGMLGTAKSGSCSHAKARQRPHPRLHRVSIIEFGAVGDGVTLNTNAFRNAIDHIAAVNKGMGGGALLYIPAGLWLTGSFTLISHLTLWFHRDAILLGSTNSGDWPVVDPLPSYGRGRELPGRRHQSLIYGHNLTDVIITGENGTIEGQGNIWWGWFHNKSLNYTRPHLIEFINSTELVISNLTFLNSPFWNIHPVYCSKVIVQNLTIRAPYDSPNTDGIDPDSSNDVCIEDCYISTGDDLVAVKSGWDEYGISFARPSTNISIYRLRGETQSSGITIGSEMSGGVSDIYVEDLFVFNTKTAITIRTSPGRGGYVKNVCISNMSIRNITTAIWFNSQYGEHPDNQYNPKALPLIEKITIKNVVGDNIRVAGLLEGIQRADFLDICLYNVTLNANSAPPWHCSHVQGYSDLVFPPLCEPLREIILPEHFSDCYHFTPNY
ncbi:probable polygalacturonase isoform X2 [Beta vulgaris subsp. vulgaris]|uniref:probable polygalacturonase isoform X2 n=1 Tax=Beta vulgaris subsp. vulgaris TaxID=3555 RepID=UPI00053FE802|nr:probable polygalacturonase isoform X2 [Beta vulgaris subsp. vulgaris]